MPTSTEAEARIGTTLGGRYRLLRVVGVGGMGVVYEGEHAVTGRRVAVKLLERAGSANAEATERFLREARLVGALGHPNVIEVLDAGTDGETLFLVLELLHGEDLCGRLARSPGPAL